MHYVINVAKWDGGRFVHYFRIEKDTFNLKQIQALAKDVASRFPHKEGFRIDLTESDHSFRKIDF